MDEADSLEMPGWLGEDFDLSKVERKDSVPPSNGDLSRQPYALALWNLIIRPPRRSRFCWIFCVVFLLHFLGDMRYQVITTWNSSQTLSSLIMSEYQCFFFHQVFSWCFFLGRCPYISIFSFAFLGTRRYDPGRLGPKKFRLWSCGVRRVEARYREYLTVDSQGYTSQGMKCIQSFNPF